MASANNGGKKPEYLERLKRQRRSSAIKFYVTAVVIGAVCGVAYIERGEIKKIYDSLTASNTAPPAQPVPPPAEPKVAETKPPPEAPRKIDEKPPEPPKPPAKVVVEPVVSPKDEARAKEILKDTRALLEKFDFSGAKKDMAEAAQLKLGAALAEEVNIWKAKTEEFSNATQHIAVADYAQGENAFIVETVDGTEWRGVKVREDEEKISLQVISNNPAAEGKQTFPIPRTEIKRTTPLPLKQRQADFGELLAGAEGGIKISHSTDFYDLVYLSKRLGLGKEAIAYLNRAFDGGAGHAPDPKVGDSFRNVVVRRVIGRATLLMLGNRRTQVELELKKLRETFPGYAFADEEIANFRSQVVNKISPDFQSAFVVKEKKKEPPRRSAPEKSKVMPPREEAVEIAVSQLTSTGPAGQALQRANTQFEDGMTIIRRYQGGVGGNTNENNRNLAQARLLFDKAIDLYEEALKLEPSNKAIRDRQTTAGQMVYFCIKNTIVGR